MSDSYDEDDYMHDDEDEDTSIKYDTEDTEDNDGEPSLSL